MSYWPVTQYCDLCYENNQFGLELNEIDWKILERTREAFICTTIDAVTLKPKFAFIELAVNCHNLSRTSPNLWTYISHFKLIMIQY